jgi:hypothetical protein
MQYNAAGDSLIAVGHAPLMLEPVDFSIEFPTKAKATLYVLDHNGAEVLKKIPIRKRSIHIKGAVHKTLYYKIIFD